MSGWKLSSVAPSIGLTGPPNGFPASWQGWAHVVISPLPSPKELKPIAADICNDEYIRIEGGRLKHSSLCTSKTHYITGVTNPSRIEQCLHTITDTAYNVAIYSNINDGQSECLYLGVNVNIKCTKNANIFCTTFQPK